jgi:pyrimidine-nucleoside phosphorylase
VTRCDALGLARLAMALGAGRVRAGDPIDPAAGIVVHRKAGDAVAAGESLATVHARRDADVHTAAVAACFAIGERPVERRPVVIEAIHA